MEKNKNILSEEIRKIYSLMGIKKSLLNEDDEDLGIETPSPTKTPIDFNQNKMGPSPSDQLGPDGDFKAMPYGKGGTSSNPIGSFNFGDFGPIHYVKEGFRAFYLTNPVDIGKLFGFDIKQKSDEEIVNPFGIKQTSAEEIFKPYTDVFKPKIGQDYYGYFEEFEKQSWSETAFGSKGNEVQSVPKIKRYFPTPQWSDFQYLIDNKIPFGFKNQDKYYTLIIKLTDPNASVFPEDSDDSRGWTMSFPGMLGSGAQDYGSPYYEVGTLEQYNTLAPKVEGDQATFALDTRSGFDKFMDSGAGQLAVMAAAVTVAILSRGWATRLMQTPGSALFTTNAMQIQTRLVIAATLGEMSINVPQALYYFNRPGYESVGFMCLCFCALPKLSVQPGFIKLIGQEYSPTICNGIAVKAMKNAYLLSAKTGMGFNTFVQMLTLQERAVFLNFLENESKNPKLIEEYFEYILEHSDWAKMSAKNIVPERAARGYAVYLAAMEIKNILLIPEESFISTFSKSIGSIVVLQQFLIGAYTKFIKKKEVIKDLEKDKNLEKKFIENAKKVDEDLRNKLSSFEMLVMTDSKMPDFQWYMYELTEAHTDKLFFDGVMPDDYYDKMRKIGIQTAIKVAKKGITDADKKIKTTTEANKMAVKYLSTVVCWDDVVKSGYEKEASEILTISGYIKTDDNTICNSARKEGPDRNKSCTTSPCWVPNVTTDETTINPNVTTDETTINPNVTTDETTINPNVTTDETTIKLDTSKNRYSCISGGNCVDVGEGKGRYPTPDCNNSCTTNKKVTEPLNP
jgi:hypothetical protein